MNQQTLIVLSVFCGIVCSHLCLLSPMQRGGVAGYEEAGATSCFDIEGPCGSSPVEKPTIMVEEGSNFTIVFQKNLDHWYAEAPGNFTVSFSMSTADEFEVLTVIPDTVAPSLTYYTYSISVPKLGFKHGVVQVTYSPNNPSAPEKFFQCADIATFRY